MNSAFQEENKSNSTSHESEENKTYSDMHRSINLRKLDMSPHFRHPLHRQEVLIEEDRISRKNDKLTITGISPSTFCDRGGDTDANPKKQSIVSRQWMSGKLGPAGTYAQNYFTASTSSSSMGFPCQQRRQTQMAVEQMAALAMFAYSVAAGCFPDRKWGSHVQNLDLANIVQKYDSRTLQTSASRIY